MSTLSQISRRAIANAQSLLKFEKDYPAVYRDAQYDLRELGFRGSRLADITGILLIATELAARTDTIDAPAKLVLSALCDWVEAELKRQAEELMESCQANSPA